MNLVFVYIILVDEFVCDILPTETFLPNKLLEGVLRRGRLFHGTILVPVSFIVQRKLNAYTYLNLLGSQLCALSFHTAMDVVQQINVSHHKFRLVLE